MRSWLAAPGGEGAAQGERDPEGGKVFFAKELDPTRPEVSAFIDQHRERFGVEPICRTLVA